MPFVGTLDLGPLTTLGVAATASAAWRFDGDEDRDGLGRFLENHGGAPLLIGGGSNLLFARAVVDEPVVLIRNRGRRIVADDGETAIVEVAAGENWDATVRWTLGLGLAGLENLILIPGTAGAAPWQNIGAYGVELAEVVEAVDAWRPADGSRRTFDRAACAFGYRDSLFKRPGFDDWLIEAVRLRLSRRPVIRADYGEIRAELHRGGLESTPIGIATAVERIRRRRLPDPAVLGNAGSFFKNPVIDRGRAERLADEAVVAGLDRPPVYPVGDDGAKLSAAWLIDRCGWKGHRDGDAGVSPDHALVLVNYGQATGADLLGLAGRIIASVEERFGVRLEPEPRIIG